MLKGAKLKGGKNAAMAALFHEGGAAVKAMPDMKASPERNLQTAKKFVQLCETGQGWDGIKHLCVDKARFVCQTHVEPIASFRRLKPYVEFWAGMVTNILQGSVYRINFEGYDASTSNASFFGKLMGTHFNDGPVEPPTRQSTETEFVYTIHFNREGKIDMVTKTQNMEWAVEELGWPTNKEI